MKYGVMSAAVPILLKKLTVNYLDTQHIVISPKEVKNTGRSLTDSLRSEA